MVTQAVGAELSSMFSDSNASIFFYGKWKPKDYLNIKKKTTLFISYPTKLLSRAVQEDMELVRFNFISLP